MTKTIKTMRLEQDQLDRLGRVLNYFGLGHDDTATVQCSLNFLENVLQGQFTVNLIGAVELVKQNNAQISKVRKDIRNLKRNTKT